MKKQDIKRLKYPTWYHIIFYCFTVVVPLILIMIEGFGAKSTSFRWTFGVLALILVAWLAIYKWLLQGIQKKVEERKDKLEHDYEIDVGNLDKIKYIWFSNEIKLAIIQAINVAVWGAFFAVVLTGIAEGVMAIKGAVILICTLYVIAYAFKFCVILYLRGNEDKGDDANGDETSEQSK